jgi:hypothetical protein
MAEQKCKNNKEGVLGKGGVDNTHKSTKLLGHGINEYSLKVSTAFKTKRRSILMQSLGLC